MVAILPRKCAYAGLDTVFFHTYTTTYPYLGGGWDWHPGSLEPMELHGYDRAGLPVGIKGRIINVADGYTDFTFGDLTGAAADGNFGGGVFRDDLLYGWAFGSSFPKKFYSYSYGLKSGITVNRPTFQTQTRIILPGSSNTGVPKPYFGTGANQPTFDKGAYLAADNELIDWTYILYQDGSIATAKPSPDLGIDNLHTLGLGLYSTTTNFYTVSPSVSGRQKLLETDFLHYAVQYNVTWENPPGGYDIDNLMVNGTTNNGQPTSYGWLLTSKATATIDGHVCNGFGVLSSPDLTSYRILRLVPIDAHSQGWTGEIGSFHCRIDSSGALWMKNVNQNSELYVSAGSVIKQLPIYPPLPIPDHGDTDPVLETMRSK